MKGTVYIVDDYPINLFILREYLKNEYIVKTFSNGEECLNEVKREVPDIVLMDFNSPLEIVHTLKKNYPSVRLMGITASQDMGYESESSTECMERVMIKPLSKPELMKCLS